MPGDRDLDRIKRPDIELGAVVKAKRLRFKQVPDTKVSFRGKPDEDSVSGSERENLPDEVEPDVTYRDVRVRWRAAAEIQPSRGARKRRS